MTPSRAWLAAARPRTLPAAIAPVVVGSALAGHDGAFQAAACALCLIFALLVQIGANFANDYYDFVRGADSSARVGPSRAVASGWIKPQAMRRATFATLALAIVGGAGLIAKGGPWMGAIGAASVICAVAYTGGPFPLGYHGLGDLFVFLFFGLVAVTMTYFVQAGRVAWDAGVAAVPVGLLAANILVVNNYRDYETDRAAGKHTLVVKLGRGFARAQYGGSVAIALLTPFVFLIHGFRPGCLLPLALAPLGARLVRRLNPSQPPMELVRLLGDTAKFLAAYAVLFAVGVNLG